jgi:hypothetical protein
MMQASFNGKPAYDLPGGGSVLGECDESRHRLRVRLEAQGSTVWESEPIELSPEPTLTHSSSVTCDYVALAWEAAGAFVVLGSPWALILDLATGKVRATFSVEYVGKPSLDIAALGLGPDGCLLLISSTKRVWVVDDTLTPVLRYEPGYLLSGPPRLIEGAVVIPEYDFDSENELIEQTIELQQDP